MILNTQDTNVEEHRQFIESTVAANTDCKWKIVTLHQDIYGSAEHSNEPEITNLRYSLVPVFEQNDIDLVLAGHDHAYSRTKMLEGGQFKMEYSDDEFEEQLEKIWMREKILIHFMRHREIFQKIHRMRANKISEISACGDG